MSIRESSRPAPWKFPTASLIAVGLAAAVAAMRPGPAEDRPSRPSSLCAAPSDVGIEGVDYETAYQLRPIRLTVDGEDKRYRRIMVSGKLGGKGKLELDPNECTHLGDFGDPGTCTLVAYEEHDVELKPVYASDPENRDRLLVEVVGAPITGSVWLIVARDPAKGAPRLLVRDSVRQCQPADAPKDMGLDAKQATLLITLEPRLRDAVKDQNGRPERSPERSTVPGSR